MGALGAIDQITNSAAKVGGVVTNIIQATKKTPTEQLISGKQKKTKSEQKAKEKARKTVRKELKFERKKDPALFRKEISEIESFMDHESKNESNMPQRTPRRTAKRKPKTRTTRKRPSKTEVSGIMSKVGRGQPISDRDAKKLVRYRGMN